MTDVDDAVGPVEELEAREDLQNGKVGVEQSIMDRLVSAREEAVSQKTVDIDLPAYKGMLVARYTLLSNETLAGIAKKAQRQFKKKDERSQLILALSQDVLIESCEGLYYRDDEGQLNAIRNGDEVVRYDQNAADFLKFEATSARDVVYQVFAENDISIVDHQIRLSRWMRDTGADVDGELLGEL